jgi:plasmid stabilization system protein ParE
MTYKVSVSPKARRLFIEANEWWVENRPAAPTLVTQETNRILAVLSDSPTIGGLYRRLKENDVRRMRLKKTPYHLYYLVNDEEREVLVLAIWSAMRNEGPPL